jgi:DNA polymerase, archaea type
MQFTENTILFGADPTPGIVAVEPSGDRAMKIYRRTADGAIESEDANFQPFLWLKDAAGEDAEALPLAGDLDFKFLARCRGWRHFQDLRADLKERNTPHFAYADPVQQYLAESGRTLFKGMVFEDLRRMQVDIETFCADGFEFPNAERETDHLMAIAVADSSGWEEFILIDRANAAASEKAALERLTTLICDRDPDVIEGHNLFKFDLPYLITRARLRKVKLAWGRDGSIPLTRASRVQIAERTIAYPKCEVAGRHVVDTYLLAQFYDVGTRELEGFGLKDVAKHFGVEGGGGSSNPQTSRTYLSGRGIQEAYLNDPESFAAYALDDVRETRAISDLLSRSYFTQAQIFPYNFQDVIVRGNATKIDALFLREYLRRQHAIPDFPVTRGFEGGYTDIFVTGVARNVWHCDVASLYPSVMLRFDCFPAADQLGIFRGLLSDLRSFRLAAKARMREAEGKPDRLREFNTASALQATFKILINSFYGYLGFSQAHFGDFDAAATVTAKGRELLRAMVDWLRERGASVIEIDTDGIYFVPPEGATEGALHEGLSAILPEGIEVEFDARYAAMFSYKAKNYALLKSDGTLLLKGGALKSRGLELFQRDYLERMIRLLLEDRAAEIPALRDALEKEIRERTIPIEELAKTDTLQDSLGQYQKKISGAARNRSAAYELALKSGRDYQPGDQIKFYITGTKKNVAVHQTAKLLSEWRADARDENVEYYVAKLNDLAEKYAEFHPGRPADNAQGSLF